MRQSEAVHQREAERLRGLKHLVGNTPLLAIHFTFRGEERVIYAKAEHLNLTGSIKDRMALYILAKAYERGEIKPGDRIAEATSGNTGISFAALGRALGHPVIIFMPDWMSRERVALMRGLGAEVRLVSREEGGFLRCVQMTKELAQEDPNVFLPDQFSNPANIEAHAATTGPEIWWQLHALSLTPDAFVAGVGTGGTLMGVGRALRAYSPTVHVYAVETTEAPILSAGQGGGHHRIQGISDDLIPPLLALDELDGTFNVHDGDAILMAQKLAKELGLAVGTSSGINFLGALLAQNKLGQEAVVATVFPDDNRKYLSTDLFGEEPVREGYLVPQVKLKRVEAFKRVCQTCCEMEHCPRRPASRNCPQ